MLNDTSLAFIRSVAEEYGAARVLLFGSCLTGPEGEAKDIDLAVEGLSSKDYHAEYNVLSPDYNEMRPRILKGTTDYDVLREKHLKEKENGK